MTTVPGPPRRPSARALMEAARRALADAFGSPRPAERYAAAHLAALRAAAAVLAARAKPSRSSGRSRPVSVWALLHAVAPELREWAAFFAAGAAKRAAAEAGLPMAVTAREADDMLRDAETFLGVVADLLGFGYQTLLVAGGG